MTRTRSQIAAVRVLSAILSLILLIAAVPITVNSVQYDKADYNDVKNEDLEDMREQLAEYQSMLKDINSKLDQAETLQTSAAEKRALYLTAKAIYADQLKDLEKTKLYYDKEIEKTGKEIAEVKIEFDKAYATFLDLLRMSYEEGSANYIEIILGAESFSDLLARIDRVNSLIRYSDKLMNTLDAQKTYLDAKYEQLLKDSEAQDEAIIALEAKQAEIYAWELENEKELADLDAQIDKLIKDHAEYENLADILEKEFNDEVNAAIAAENKRREELALEAEREEERRQQEALEEAIRKQQFLWPLPVAWNYISYTYGYRTMEDMGYYNKFHYGIDVPAYRGTDIYASKAGKVLTAKYHTSYGYYVLIDHGSGYQTLYAHASKLYVTAGQYVEQGQVIAAVGTTGSSNGNHLHFEVRVNGKLLNPLDYVKKP